MAKKFVLEKAPFIRSVDEKIISTKQMMRDLVIALIPIILFAWVKNGLLPYIFKDTFRFVSTIGNSYEMNFWQMLRPLVFILLGGLFSMLLEGLYFAFFKYYFPNKYTTPKLSWNFKAILEEVKLSYAVIPGLILALILPVNTPIYVLFFGCFFANIIFKMLYGGFGKNIFNPALIAYVIVLAAFWGVISNAGGSLNPSEVVTGATPLYNFKGLADITYENVVLPYGSLWNFFLGFVPGSMGETCSLLIILACIFLISRKVISWVIPVFYVGTVFVLSLVIAWVNDYGMWYPTFQVLSGGLLFGAVFMATEPVTTPRSPNGKAIFAGFAGILTMLFRLVGSLTGGVATALLFVGLFSGVIDRIAAKLRTHRTNYRSILGYLVIILLMIALSFYVIMKVKI